MTLARNPAGCAFNESRRRPPRRSAEFLRPRVDVGRRHAGVAVASRIVCHVAGSTGTPRALRSARVARSGSPARKYNRCRLRAATEGCQTARKAFPRKVLKKHRSATHTPTHTKKDPFFRCLGCHDSRFQRAERRFESHSGQRPRIYDCNLASGEILHFARGQRRPS